MVFHKPLVSAVILTINRCEDLKRCLDSLMRQTYRDFDILVIDNGSSDSTLEVLKTYPVRVIVDTTKKLSYLFNLGWKRTSGDYVAYFADDVELHTDWIKNAVKSLKQEAVGAVGGPIISTKKQEMHLLYEKARQSNLLSFVAKIYERIVMEGKLFEPGALAHSGAYSMGASLESSMKLKSPILVDLLTTSAMIVKREVFSKVGGFDENFYFNHADGDFFIRMKKAGYKLLFNPKVVAWHHVRLGPSRNPYYVGRDTGYFFAKDIRPKTLSAWIGYILNIGYFIGYWAYKTSETKDLNQLRGISAFLSGICEYLKEGSKSRG